MISSSDLEKGNFRLCERLFSSVVDPDHYVFGPPGSGSVRQGTDPDPSIISKNCRKILIHTVFCDFFDFYLRKISRKTWRPRTKIAESEPKCQGSTALLLRIHYERTYLFVIINSISVQSHWWQFMVFLRHLLKRQLTLCPFGALTYSSVQNTFNGFLQHYIT